MPEKYSSTPRFTMDVTDKEKNRAAQIKGEFKKVLRELDDSLRLIYDLKDAMIQDHPSKEDLQNKYIGRLLRYRRTIQSSFNNLLIHLKAILESFSLVVDPEMLKLREIIVAEFDELSDGVESLLSLLGDAGRAEFTKSLERLTTQLQKRQRSIKSVIDDQLFSHLETDILGKMKISNDFRGMGAKIIKRTRLLRKLSGI